MVSEGSLEASTRVFVGLGDKPCQALLGPCRQ